MSVSLSADGNIVAIGAPYNDGNGYNSGSVRVFKYDYYTIPELYNSGITFPQLYHAGITISQLTGAGYTIKQLCDGGITSLQLIGEGFTIQQLYDAGISFPQLYNGGITISQLIGAEYTIQQLYEGGITFLQLVASNYTILQLIDAGYTVKQLFDGGINVSQLTSLGYTVKQLYDAGIIFNLRNYIIKELYNQQLIYNTVITSTTVINVDDGVYNLDLSAYNFYYNNYSTGVYQKYTTLCLSSNGYMLFNNTNSIFTGESQQTPINSLRFFSFDARSTVKYYILNNELFISALGSFYDSPTNTPFDIVIKITQEGSIYVYYKSIGLGSYKPIIGWVGNNSSVTTDDIFYFTFDGVQTYNSSNINGKLLQFDFRNTNTIIQDYVSQGLTFSQLVASNFTILQLTGVGYTIKQLYDGGITVSQLITTYTIQQLYDAGISFPQLYDGGITILQLTGVGYTIKQLYDGGITVSQLITTYTIQQLYDAGISFPQLYDGGITILQLTGAGYTIKQLYDGGITILQLITTYTIKQLYDAGITVSQLITTYTIKQLYDAGISFPQLYDGGINISQLINAGYTVLQLFNGGITKTQLIDAGYLPVITDISWNSVSLTNISIVTITGRNFTSEDSFSFAGTPINRKTFISTSNPTQLTCYLSIGIGNIQITTIDGITTEFGPYTVVKYSISSNICFPKDTPIVTDQGLIEIEKINPEKNTIRGKKIVAITETITPDKYLVCFEKDALGPNLPSKDTTMSQNHCVFYKGEMIEAKRFLYKFENIKRVKYNGEYLYNVLLENHDKMIVNNLVCETLSPKNTVARLYHYLSIKDAEQKNMLIKEFNKYNEKNNTITKEEEKLLIIEYFNNYSKVSIK